MGQSKPAEAFVWLLSALQCQRTHRPTHAALAKYYAAVGKPQAAERHLAWASEQENGSTERAEHQ